MTKNGYCDFFILLVISCIIIFFNLGGIPLLDPDEPVYAETAKEMFLNHDFISPRIYGEFWYDKPPMYYWLVAAASHVFGSGEFAARLPSALLSIVCLSSVYLFVRKIFNNRTAMLSALILATSIEYFYLSKAAVTDITLTLCITVSLLSFMTKRYYIFYLFMGLAILTKGPIGFMPAVIAAIYLVITRNLSTLRNMKVFSGLLLIFLVCVPWYGMMYHLHGTDFIDTFFGFHNLTRFASPEHPTQTWWWYYIPVLLVGFFPWSALLVQSVYHSIVDATKQSQEIIFLNIWAGFVFFFFSIAQTKLVSYILPMYPAIAILVAWHVDQIWDGYYYAKRQYIWGSIIFILTAGAMYGAFQGLETLPELSMGVFLLSFVLGFMGIFTVYFLWNHQVKNAFCIHVLGMIGISAVIFGYVFPAVAPKFSSAESVKEFMPVYDSYSPVYISKFLRPGFAFYGNVYGNELYFSPTSIPDFNTILQKDPQAYFVLRDIDYKKIPESIKAQLILLKTINNQIILKGKEETTINPK